MLNNNNNLSNLDLQDDENRRDFELLLKRNNSSTNKNLISTNNNNNNNFDKELWPLTLTTYFLDNYIFGDVIGNGAYAEVRECVNTKTLERCAVKIINKNYLIRQAPKALANQEQEIKFLKKLKHQNIISIKETLYKNSKIYIFLEYCPFVLSDLLKSNSDYETINFLPIKLIRNLFKQLLFGLEYLHSNSIVHRDIKPQNLLINTSGVLKIIDFGVSQLLSIWSYPSDLCKNYEGSPLFQAPEVVSGQLNYGGFKVDVWSSGITLYLMIYGKYPFMDEALLGLYDKILSEPPKLESSFFENNDDQLGHDHHQHDQNNNRSCFQITVLNDLLSRLLEKEAKKRCSIAEALKHPWLLLASDNNNNNSSSCNSNNNDSSSNYYEDCFEHSEFIELLQNQHNNSLLSPTSKDNNNNNNHLNANANVNNNEEKKKKKSSSKDNKKDFKKQKDIYLSMSVLPYLYSHHFSHLPVVKANTTSCQRTDCDLLTNWRVNESIENRQCEETTSCSSLKTSSSTSNSSAAKQNKIKDNSSSTSSTINTNLSISNTDFSNVNNNFDSKNPNEIISDKQIEWGTERQYNLLKLPLIRANRLRHNKSSNNKLKKKPNFEGKMKIRRRCCERRKNSIADEDIENDENNNKNNYRY